MPSVATQTAFEDVPSSATLGSPRHPILSTMDWSMVQPKSWESRISTRRGGMRKKEYLWFMRHAYSQTDGGMYNAAAWEIIAAENQQ